MNTYRSMLALASTCLVLATGCVRRPPMLFTHPTKPPTSFEADKYECEVKARQVLQSQYGDNPLAMGLYLDKEIIRCLEAHGWVAES